MDDLSDRANPRTDISPRSSRPPVLEALPAAGASATGRRLGSVPAYAAATVITVVAILSQYVLPDAVPAAPRRSTGRSSGTCSSSTGSQSLPSPSWSAGARSRGSSTTWAVPSSRESRGTARSRPRVRRRRRPDDRLRHRRPERAQRAQQDDARDPVGRGRPVVLGRVLVRHRPRRRGDLPGLDLRLLARQGPEPLGLHATWTSGVFAGVRSVLRPDVRPSRPAVFPSLFFLGFAFAAAMRASGGNVIVVAILHGVNDAVAFYSLVSANGALALHYGLILIGASSG